MEKLIQKYQQIKKKNRELHKEAEKNVNLQMEYNNLKKLVRGNNGQALNGLCSLDHIQVSWNKREDVPALNLNKLNEPNEITDSCTSSELDRRIESALEDEIRENPNVVEQFGSVKELKR